MKRLAIILLVLVLHSCDFSGRKPDFEQAVNALRELYHNKIVVSNPVLIGEREIAPGQSSDRAITFSCEVEFMDNCSFDLRDDQYYHNGVFTKAVSMYNERPDWWANPMYVKGDKFDVYETSTIFDHSASSSYWTGSSCGLDDDTRKTEYVGKNGKMSFLRYKLMRLYSQKEHFNEQQFENLVNSVKDDIEAGIRNGYHTGN